MPNSNEIFKHPTEYVRKVIQIETAVVMGQFRLYALCDDGTIWRRMYEFECQWERVNTIGINETVEDYRKENE